MTICTCRYIVVDIYSQFHDGIHPFVIDAYAELGATFHAQRRLEEAERRQRWILEQRKEWLRECHPDLAKAMYDLSLTCQELDKHKEAKSLAKQAEVLQAKALGYGHPLYIKTAQFLQELEHSGALTSQSPKLPLIIISILICLILYILGNIFS